MAIMRNGILGGLSGKVGPVVALINGNNNVLRAKPRRLKKFTVKELENQSKFRTVQTYLYPFIDLLRVGLNNYYTETGGFRAAIAYTRKNALLADGNNFVVDANKLKISGGHLTPPIDPKIRINADKLIVIKWEHQFRKLSERK